MIMERVECTSTSAIGGISGGCALILNEDSGGGSSNGGGFFISVTAVCWRGVFNHPYSVAVPSFGVDDRSDRNQFAARGMWRQPH
ncbi:hypothetical protein Y032_0087g2010 [Ancylostoma ceylanicum]|uniref:Uncharacterized protein n=1 Tax=Ancylostoma ceylanicum TaxID=53326 RepID=A0A016TP80_9BILA|nr:hypothetical protein Y032_0087g2010 [Ancylostoma ceylanicum]